MSVFTRSRTATILGGIAIAGASALVLAGCSGGGTGGESSAPPAESVDLSLKIGTILPQTGTLAFLGPPEEAGVGLAAQDINDAAVGLTIPDIIYGDSGDTDNKAYATTIQKLISEGVTAVIGAASSGVTKLFLDDVIAAGIIQFSPANTSPDFTTWDDNGLYWRTAPSDTLQGEVLGNLIAEDGHENVAVLYHERLVRHRAEQGLRRDLHGRGRNDRREPVLQHGDTTFDAQISAILASNPDAIVADHVRRDLHDRPGSAGRRLPGRPAVPRRRQPEELRCRRDWPADASMEGAKGTTPAGPLEADESFQERLNEFWTGEGNSDLTDFSLRQRVLRRRHPARARSARGQLDGPRRRSPASCRKSPAARETVRSAPTSRSARTSSSTASVADYDGHSGPITFDENGDPTEATVGVFQYGPDNMSVRIS